MDLGVVVNIRENTDLAQAFGQAREAGFERGQVNLLTHGITPDDVRDAAVAAQYAGFHVDAVGCPVNPLRPDDATLSGIDMTDWRTVAANMGMMNGVERLICWSGTRGKFLDVPSLLNSEPDTFRVLYTALHGMTEDTEGMGIRILLVPHTAHVLCDAAACVKMLRQFPAGQIRLVLDAAGTLSLREYEERDSTAQGFVREVGPLVALTHLRDTLPPAEGTRRFALPGAGTLAYGPLLKCVAAFAPDVPAVVAGTGSVEQLQAARQFVQSTVREYGL